VKGEALTDLRKILNQVLEILDSKIENQELKKTVSRLREERDYYREKFIENIK
jgi:ubiquitin-protein ligase